MRHLTSETLARLVDEEPSGDERDHLASCPRCAAELDALRDQTDALASMPDRRPPADGWSDLEERLRGDGLLRPAGDESFRRAGAPAWLRAAAAIVLFLGGAAVGTAATRAISGEAGGEAGSEAGSEAAAVAEVEPPASASVADASPDELSVDRAAQRLVAAEEQYVDALIQYRRLARESGEEADAAADPAGRFAALEALVATSRAALREAPADPFLNGVLAGAVAERQATLRTIAAEPTDDWY